MYEKILNDAIKEINEDGELACKNTVRELVNNILHKQSKIAELLEDINGLKKQIAEIKKPTDVNVEEFLCK